MTKAYSRFLFMVSFVLFYVWGFIGDLIPGGFLLLPLSVALGAFVYLQTYGVRLHGLSRNFMIYLAAFTLFCFLSRFWAENPKLGVPKTNSLVMILIGMSVFSLIYFKTRDIDAILKVVMYGGYIVVFFCAFRFGWKGLLQLASDSTRISSDAINANSLGMRAAYSILLHFYYIVYRGEGRFRRKLRKQDVLILPALFVLAVTGSRKAILILVLGLFLLYLLKNVDRKDIVRTVLKFLLIVLLFVAGIFLLSRLPMFSTITKRVENLISLLKGNETRKTSDAWIRLAYMRLGIDLFLQHPWVGIGIANANIYTLRLYKHDHYLHCNYAEMLACGGIVGFLLYYVPYFRIFRIFWKHRKRNERQYNICFLLLILSLIMDFGVVSYYSKHAFVFLMMFWIEAGILEEKGNPLTVIQEKIAPGLFAKAGLNISGRARTEEK